MTPAELTQDVLISWGGEDVFNQAVGLARFGEPEDAVWDDYDHAISGRVKLPDGQRLSTWFELLDDSTIISHCPCAMHAVRGLVCPHVVLLGLYMMVQWRAQRDGAAEEAARRVAEEEARRRYETRPPERFRVRLFGSRASVSAVLSARYAGGALYEVGEAAPAKEVVAADPNDPDLFYLRDFRAEEAAAAVLKSYGCVCTKAGDGSCRHVLSEPREVLNFLGGGIPFLRRLGWECDLSDRLAAVMDSMSMVIPVVRVEDAPGGAFDVGLRYELALGGETAKDARDLRRYDVSAAEIQGALNRGDSYLLTAGRTLLVDSEAIQSVRETFAQCALRQGDAGAGRFRLAPIYAAYVRSSLDRFDGIDVADERAPAWRARADRQNRARGVKFEPVDLGPLDGTLRDYQKTGVAWMRFLETSGLAGLLADEMGLGKTLQTLAWLTLERTNPAARGKPALVVCPTSLVRNWEEEARRFAPRLKTLVLQGADRAGRFGEIAAADIVITSYALLPRDFAAAYAGRTFGAIVLDEAQHVKNRATLNARTVKALAGFNRIALTGTPVENGVADAWSIFDFLLPGYLGEYEAFRDAVEAPVALGGKDGDAALAKLHRLLHPFVLRRLKKTVAADLPDKIETVNYCPMAPEQRREYDRTLRAARGTIGELVKAKGFARAKFEIFAILMRLRQIANHPGTLKDYRAPADASPASLSGKTEAFFDLLDGLIAGGHRVLVFSQYVSMLRILRAELEARGIAFCYLDGSTRDRLDACRRFNADASVPVFLISLRAGGTGLNLTGADTVVHFDPWWNPAVEAQATDRAHRIGQKKSVCVVKLITEDSVEERVLALQRRKQLVIDATVDATDAQVLERLTLEDVQSLLGGS